MKDINSFKNDYQNIIDSHSPKNKVLQNSFRAFWVGGTFCLVGEALNNFYTYNGLNELQTISATTITLIFIASILTALNIYDKIGNYAGAGSIVPITGFANAMVSAAMEFKKEGFIYGMGAKLFSISGPVIVFGTIASVIIGVVYYIM